MKIDDRLLDPSFDPTTLSDDDKVSLVRQTDGLLWMLLPKHINGSIYLSGLAYLERLPDEMYVKDNLHLQSCTSLVELSESLEVGGLIFLWNCTSLRKVPRKFRRQTENWDWDIIRCHC